MATIISRYRTSVAMTNSIHALLSENHPCTLFMVSLHPGYHDPPISIHYHMLRSDDGAAKGCSAVLGSVVPRCFFAGLLCGRPPHQRQPQEHLPMLPVGSL